MYNWVVNICTKNQPIWAQGPKSYIKPTVPVSNFSNFKNFSNFQNNGNFPKNNFRRNSNNVNLRSIQPSNTITQEQFQTLCNEIQNLN